MAKALEKFTIGALPSNAAAKFGDREALYFKGKRWSFAGLDQIINRAAKGLLQMGVQQGDKVAIWIPNGMEFIQIFFALAKIGAIVVPINTWFRTSDAAYILRQSETSVLIAVDRSGPVNYLSMVRELVPSVTKGTAQELCSPESSRLKRIVLISNSYYEGMDQWTEIQRKGERFDDEAFQRRYNSVTPDATAFIMYTSGTTGFPKGVMHCHNILRNIRERSVRMEIYQKDVILIYLPLFHMLGLFEGPIMSMITGARLVLTERFNPTESLELIEQEKVTLVHGFDTHFKDLTEAQQKENRNISSLRSGICATGMSNSIPIARKVHKILCPGMVSAYGIAEIGVGVTISFLTSTEEQRCEASGYPAPGYEIKVIDPDSGEDQLINKPGEILVRGYSLMQGYFNKRDETIKVIDPEGWLHTGDMGVIREDGHLRFIGRYKERLKIGGENVDPREVEGYLLSHPAIRQVAVVGYPDDRLSEVGVAFIQLEPDQNLTQADAINYCKGKIASYKIPKHVIFLEEFPMTASGKIQKFKLKKQAFSQIKVNNQTAKC